MTIEKVCVLLGTFCPGIIPAVRLWSVNAVVGQAKSPKIIEVNNPQITNPPEVAGRTRKQPG